MKKYQKLLSTFTLVSLPFINPINAVDLHYDIDGVNITMNNVRTDPIHGIRFDTINVAGQVFTEDSIDEFVKHVFSLPDDDIVNINGFDLSAGDIKEAIDIFEGEYEADVIAKITSDLQAQGVSPEEQNRLLHGLERLQDENSTFIHAEEYESVDAQIEQAQKILVPMVYSATVQVSDIVVTRTDSLDILDRFVSNQGLAAGDNAGIKHGLWIKGNISKDNYKQIAGLRLNARTAGVIIGYDARINDNIMAGLAFGYQHSNLSSKLKLRTLVGSAYGRYNFDIPFFMDAKYSYSASVFTGEEKKSGLNLLALGFNNFHTVSTEVGYNHSLDNNLEITPTAGLKFIAHDWKLSKKWFGDVDVKTKNGNATYATIDLRLKGMINTDLSCLMPYISTGFESRINHHKTKLTITDTTSKDSVTLPVDVSEANKFTAGTGVNAKINEVFSASLGYKYTKTKLYNSHSGTLGLRLDF